MKTIALLLLCPLFAAATEVRLERVPESGVQPEVAVSSDGTVHLVYLTGQPDACDIHYATRAPGGTAGSAPVTVNSESQSAVAVGTIRGAQLATGRDGHVHVVWNGRARKGGNATAPLCYARLEGGKFAPQRTLNTGTIHLDGGASVAADGKGGVFVVWHAAPPDGKSEADRRIYVCRSSDDGATFTAAEPAAGAQAGVCPCCSLKACVAPDGTLLTFYRSAIAKDRRDMILLSSRGSGPFNGSVIHPWSIAACPMSSAALIGTNKSTRAAWETDGAIYTAVPGEKDKPLAVSGGKARHPALSVNLRGETLVSWSIGTGWQRGGELGWVLLDEKGQPTATKGTAQEVPVWSHTAVFPAANGDFVILH